MLKRRCGFYWLFMVVFLVGIHSERALAIVPAIESSVGACLSYDGQSSRLDEDGQKSLTEFLKVVRSIPFNGRVSADLRFGETNQDETYEAALLAVDRQDSLLSLLGAGAPSLKSSTAVLTIGGRGPISGKCAGSVSVSFLADRVAATLCSGKGWCRLQCTKDGCN